MPNETGHAKNVANFTDLTTTVASLGATYNPSNINIQSPALLLKKDQCQAALLTYNTQYAPYKNAVADMKNAISPLSKLMTKVQAAAKASGLPTENLDNIKSLIRKIKGTRASVLATPATPPSTPPTDVTPPTSSSQMSYDNRIQNLQLLNQLLSTLPQYNPNEDDIKLPTLTTYALNLNTKNQLLNATLAPLNAARANRDEVLYKEKTGALTLADLVKTYIKSVYGASSTQYKQINRLKFTKVAS
ncbi:MAG: hypothetical protein NTX03_03800 [Bacteroidetes bacterium]|nr:hypothetical protein [Bacteroidota bacterium]